MAKSIPVKTGYTATGMCRGEVVVEGDTASQVASQYVGQVFAGRVGRWHWKVNDATTYYQLTDTGQFSPEGRPIEPVVQLQKWWSSPNFTPAKARRSLNGGKGEHRFNVVAAWVLFVIFFGGLGIWLPIAIYGTAALSNWFFYVWAGISFITSGGAAARMAETGSVDRR